MPILCLKACSFSATLPPFPLKAVSRCISCVFRVGDESDAGNFRPWLGVGRMSLYDSFYWVIVVFGEMSHAHPDPHLAHALDHLACRLVQRAARRCCAIRASPGASCRLVCHISLQIIAFLSLPWPPCALEYCLSSPNVRERTTCHLPQRGAIMIAAQGAHCGPPCSCATHRPRKLQPRRGFRPWPPS